MSDVQTIAAGLAAVPLTGALTAMAHRAYAVLRPTGQHRATAPDMTSLAELIDTGQVDANDLAYCPEEMRRTYHALHADGSRRCWTCHTDTPAGA